MNLSKYKLFHKYNNTITRNIFILFGILFILFIFSSYVFFNDYKTNIIMKSKNEYKFNIEYLNLQFEKYLINNDNKKLIENLNNNFNSKFISKIDFKFKNFLFDKNTLFLQTKNLEKIHWNILDISIDAKYGKIKKLTNSQTYQYIPLDNKIQIKDIPIKYQIRTQDDIKQYLLHLNFGNIQKIFFQQNKFKIPSWFMYIIQPDIRSIEKELHISNIKFGNIVYNIDTSSVSYELYNLFINLILFTLILFIPILIILNYYHLFVLKKYVTEPIQYLNSYLDKLNDNKFEILNKNNFEGRDELKELTQKISKISGKFSSLINEVNVAKETIERQALIDQVTGLANRQRFDFDIKSMFINEQNGFVFLLKVDCLGQLSQNYDVSYINSFLEAYINIIKNTIYKYSKTDIMLYRFYGSDFAIIIKEYDFSTCTEILQLTIKNINTGIKDIFDTSDNIILIGGTKFDLYGSVDSILKSSYQALEIARKQGNNTLYINSESNTLFDTLHDNIVNMINDGTFEINFTLSTYLFDEPKELIMQEVKAVLLDKNNSKIDIGSFISIAKHIQKVDAFDKLMVEKTLAYINGIDKKYFIAINISFSSINKFEFMQWLEDILNKYNSIKKYIVFSVTSYTASLNKKSFEKFVKKIDEIGSKVLLKRYKIDEYPLQFLNNLPIGFIRIAKDYTNNFSSDMIKKHKVKSILIYGELNEIEIIADKVDLDADYDLLERSGTYAICR